VVDADRAAAILSWARTELPADPNGGGPDGDVYRVTTLYFDTPELDCFRRCGSYGRAKYRIRRYDASPDVVFERKMRTATMLAKRRSIGSLAVIDRLLAQPTGAVDEAAWFARRINRRNLRPVCVVAYQRAARQIRSPSGGLSRLTVDTDVSAGVANRPDWLTEPQRDVLPGQSVVELKYQFAAPVLFKAVAERFGLNPETFSKYRHTVAMLDLAATPAPARTQSLE
jgi:hypothetical protein